MDRVRECVAEGMSEEETRGRVRYDRRWKSVPDSFHKRFEIFYDLAWLACITSWGTTGKSNSSREMGFQNSRPGLFVNDRPGNSPFQVSVPSFGLHLQLVSREGQIVPDKIDVSGIRLAAFLENAFQDQTRVIHLFPHLIPHGVSRPPSFCITLSPLPL
jgi:hypothetical protein